MYQSKRIETTTEAAPAKLLRVTVIELAAGEILFTEGVRKAHIYRVETGTICTYQASGAGSDAVREFSYAGDWLGFGYLDRQISRGRALTATRVACFPRACAQMLAELFPRAATRLDAAVEREFEFQREAATQHSAAPTTRVAAFLLSLAAHNATEGRDASIIVDAVPSGVVADYLAMSLDILASALVDLERRGLIDPNPPHGLRIKDVAGLETVAAPRLPEAARPMRQRSASPSASIHF